MVISSCTGKKDYGKPFLKLAANLAINAREAARVRRTVSLDVPLPSGETREPADPNSAEVAAAASDEERRVAIRAEVAALDPRYAACVGLFYLEGLSVKEIGERLDLPEGTVKIRLHRAREALKERLARFRGDVST